MSKERQVIKVRLWGVQALGEDLREDRLTEPTKALYLATSVVLGMVVGGGGVFRAGGQPYGLLIWMAVVGCYGLGLLAAFQRNQAGDGIRFIERYICLGVPAFVRMICLMYGTYYALWMVAGDWMTTNAGNLWYALSVPSLAAYFWWIWQGIAVAAGAER
jgi:hypothetical protein